MTDTAASLGSVLKRGAAMSAAGLVIAQTAGIVQTLVLGRLLGPDEVGVFVAGTVMMGFLLMAAQGALSQALIHRKTDVEDAANTVLVVNFGAGLLGSLALLAASPLIGMLFHSSRVGLVAAAASGLLLLHVCGNVPDALMQRAFQFKRQMIIPPADFDRVRGCLDRVRHPGIRRVGNGHRVVRIDHHRGRAELVDGEMAPVPWAVLVPHLA